MKALLAALLLACIAGTASAEALCGGPITNKPELDRFGDVPIGTQRLGPLAMLTGPCDEGCGFVDRHGVRYVVAESFERKTLDFSRYPAARGPLGLSAADTLQTARKRLSKDRAVGRALRVSADGSALVTHYCFRDQFGTDFGLELHFEAGHLARYETYILSPRL